jgi:hypothetical protein
MDDSAALPEREVVLARYYMTDRNLPFPPVANPAS